MKPINVLLTGATGMVGRGVLIECLESADVGQVVVFGRRPCGVTHPKLTEILHDDFLNVTSLEASFSDLDACFYCLGTSSAGIRPDVYRTITFDYPVKLAESLVRVAPQMTFILLTGAGTDSTGSSRLRWARVKGEAENAILKMGFKAAFAFRPGYIQPMKGVVPSFAFYNYMRPIYPVLTFLFRKSIANTIEVGQAMINVALNGSSKRVLESGDIIKLVRTR